MTKPIIKKWEGHEGSIIDSVNGFEVIDCKPCGFKHIIPIPTEKALEQTYQNEYYLLEKPLYIERFRKDLEWWNFVYTQRYEILEQHLPAKQRSLLDIGSGPGFFLLNGKNRGWRVKGVEPSVQAAKHSITLGLEIDNVFFSKETAPKIGKFDAINMSEVLEHIPDPTSLLSIVYDQLNEDGLVCIVVPNDFNPFQIILHEKLNFKSWWIAPPHHINYFDFTSLEKLLKKCGFEVIHKESTFPIDIFLLMGDNYIGNDRLGRICHSKRMKFEKNIHPDLLRKLYSSLVEHNIGREIVLFAKKIKK